MRHGLAALLYGTIALVLCGPLLDNRFCGDDFIWLYDASRVTSIADLFAVHDVAFAHYDGIRLNPTTNLFFALGWPLFGLHPMGYHLMAFALYVLTALLVLTWMVELDVVWPGGLFAGAAFLLYPAHAEPVSWLSATGEILVGLFSITALLAFVRWRRGRGVVWYALAMLSLLAAALAKESALVLPAVLMLADLALVGNTFRLRRHLLAWAIVVVVAGWKISMFAAHRGDVAFQAMGADIVSGSLFYLTGTLAAAPLPRAGPVASGLGVAAACAFVLWTACARRRRVAFHGAWMILAVQPYVWFVPGNQWFDRYTWQASVPLVCLLGCVLGWALERLRRTERGLMRHVAAAALAICVAGVLGHFATEMGTRVAARSYADDTPALQSSARAVLEGLGTEGRVYVYNELTDENAAGRALSLLGSLDPDRIQDWYDALCVASLGSGDRFVFYDDEARTFSDATVDARRALACLSGRLYETLRPRDAAGARLGWDFRREADRWVPLGGLRDLGNAYETQGIPAMLRSPDLDLSPFAVFGVEVTYALRAGQGEPLIGWRTDDPRDVHPARFICALSTSCDATGEARAWFLPPSYPTWWNGGRIRRLYLMPSPMPATVDIRAVRIHTFGALR